MEPVIRISFSPFLTPLPILVFFGTLQPGSGFSSEPEEEPLTSEFVRSKLNGFCQTPSCIREFFEQGKILYGDFKIKALDPDFRKHFILEQGEIYLFLYTKMKKDLFHATLVQNRINPLTRKPLSYVSDVTITFIPPIPETTPASTLFSFFKGSS